MACRWVAPAGPERVSSLRTDREHATLSVPGDTAGCDRSNSAPDLIRGEERKCSMRKWHANPWAVLLTGSLGFFMTLLDLTIVNIAIPNMIDQLHASLDEVLWVVNGYVLVLAVLL